MANVWDLIQQDVPLKQTSRGEWHGPCPGCGGTDRFCVWPERSDGGRYWCRQCGRSGGLIRYLCDFRGLSFGEAKRTLGLEIPDDSPRLRADRVALARVREEYLAWDKQCLIEVTDAHRELLAQREDAEIACGAIKRRPTLYSQKEKHYWTSQRVTLDEQIKLLQHDLDLFTYNKYLPERIARWALTQKSE